MLCYGIVVSDPFEAQRSMKIALFLVKMFGRHEQHIETPVNLKFTWTITACRRVITNMLR